jgi:hypothetical protein
MRWQRINPIAAAANPPEPPTIGGILYPGKRTILSGETESLKSWFALVLAKAELDIGYSVAWADLDAMGAGELLARLRALDVPDEVISSRFLLYEPDSPLRDDALDAFLAEITEANVRLFVVDAFNSMLGLHALDPNKTADIDRFWRQVAQPICDAGIATVLIDHVVKNTDARGRYAIGSERKASGAHLHLGFQPLKPFARGGARQTRLRTHKDRTGFLPRPTVGILEFVSDGDSVTYSLREDRSRATDVFRPTNLMGRVSDYLAIQDAPVSRTNVADSVTGKTEYIRTALDVLIAEGYVQEHEGKGGARPVALIRAYREDDDVVSTNDDETPSRPRPNPVPTLVSTALSDPVPPSPPVRGDRGGAESRPRPDGPSPSREGETSFGEKNGSNSDWRSLSDFDRARRFDEMYPRRRECRAD